MSDSYLDAICNITIDTGGAQVTREGFGRALILANADWQTALTGLYTSLADMVAAGCNPVLPEYLAAAALFSQNPKPKDVKIGKLFIVVVAEPPRAQLPHGQESVLHLAVVAVRLLDRLLGPLQVDSGIRGQYDLLDPGYQRR